MDENNFETLLLKLSPQSVFLNPSVMAYLDGFNFGNKHFSKLRLVNNVKEPAGSKQSVSI